MPEPDEETLDEYLAEDQRALREVRDSLNLFTPLARVNVPDGPDLPLGFGTMEIDYTKLSLDVLVELRELHQTYHAANAVRTRAGTRNKDDQREGLRCCALPELHPYARDPGHAREQEGARARYIPDRVV